MHFSMDAIITTIVCRRLISRKAYFRRQYLWWQLSWSVRRYSSNIIQAKVSSSFSHRKIWILAPLEMHVTLYKFLRSWLFNANNNDFTLFNASFNGIVLTVHQAQLWLFILFPIISISQLTINPKYFHNNSTAPDVLMWNILILFSSQIKMGICAIFWNRKHFRRQSKLRLVMLGNWFRKKFVNFEGGGERKELCMLNRKPLWCARFYSQNVCVHKSPNIKTRLVLEKKTLSLSLIDDRATLVNLIRNWSLNTGSLRTDFVWLIFYLSKFVAEVWSMWNRSVRCHRMWDIYDFLPFPRKPPNPQNEW